MQKEDEQALFQIVDQLQEGGTDVQNFIKQLLLYIEEHMHEDMPTMLSLADILKNINISLRSFPQPYIIIKSELYKYFHPRNFETASEQVKKKSSSLASNSQIINQKAELNKEPSNNNTQIENQTSHIQDDNRVLSTEHSGEDNDL